MKSKIIICNALLLLLFSGCGESDEPIGEADISTTTPVAWGHEIPEDAIEMNHAPGESEFTEKLAWVRLIFRNLPEEEEGNSYTLIGGGLDDTGFHGPNATGFEGKGYHFAIPEDAEGENPPRDENYKLDYTRTVENSTLTFDIYYQPTDINEWGERYFPGTEVALTLMKTGTEERVLHADNNEYNWAIAGVGEGNAAEIIIDLPSP